MTERAEIAWCFLNVRDPMCAWNAYRGVLAVPPAKPGFVSVWTAAVIRRQAKEGGFPFVLEAALEQVRRKRFSNRRPRLSALFCFEALADAERAVGWGGPRSHFQPDFLTKLDVSDAIGNRDRLDANWVTHAPRLTPDSLVNEPAWMDRYWAGEPMEGREPVWETLIGGPVRVVTEEIRERGYSLVARNFPNSLPMLEIGRLAAKIGSDRGNIFAWIYAPKHVAPDLRLDYLLNNDENAGLMAQLRTEVLREQHSPRIQAVGDHLASGEAIRTPDLRALGVRIPRVFYPFKITPPEG